MYFWSVHWNIINDFICQLSVYSFGKNSFVCFNRGFTPNSIVRPGVSVLVLFVLIEGRLLISYWLVLQMIILLPGAGQTRMWNYYIGPKSFFKWIRPKMVPKIFSNGTMVSNNFLDLKSIFEIWNKFLNFKTQFEIWN